MEGNAFMKYLRIFLAWLSLAAMTVLFVLPGAAFTVWFGWLPRAQFVPAVMAGEVVALAAIAVSVAFFGRIYCSLICPLGIAQDAVRWLFNVTGIGRVWRIGTVGRVVRYAVLALFIAGVFFGFTGLIAPYGIFGRFVSVGVMRFGDPPVIVVIWAIALFAFILLMTFFRARWWCNQVCPVGTLLGIFSRFASFRVRIDGGKCVGCGLCAKACDKGAIVKDGKKVTVDSSLCVTCLNCAGSCRKGALRWR